MAGLERQQQRMDELAAELGEKHGRVLASPAGKELLAYLERKFFDGDLLGSTPEETAFNLGAREVVRRMRTVAAQLDSQETTRG